MKYLLASLLAVFSISISACADTGRRSFTLESPRLHVFLPSATQADGRAVLILPGGGYSHLAVNHEGLDWADFFNSRGIAAAVLEYPMPEGNSSVPYNAVMETLKLMRDSASTWGFSPDSIGIMGSSAGGHLASTVSTHAPAAERPAFQILLYPVISMDPALTHRGSHDKLLGPDATAEQERRFSNETRVDSSTPKAFIALSSDDRAVPPMNSVGYYQALLSAGVPASMHIYPTGGHGWGFREKFIYHNQVLDELDAWLRNMK